MYDAERRILQMRQTLSSEASDSQAQGAFQQHQQETQQQIQNIEHVFQIMGQQQCAQFFEQNLQQEQAVAQRITQLGQQMIGMMGQSGQSPQMQMGQQGAGGI